MKRIALASVLIGAVLVTGIVIAATIPISATIPSITDVTTAVSKIDSKGTVEPGDDTWSNATTVSFGTLVLDPVNKIYKTADNSYYAIDIGVNGAGAYTLQHSVSGAAFTGTGTNTLGDNVVVTFVKQYDATNSDPLVKSGLSSYGKTIIANSALTVSSATDLTSKLIGGVSKKPWLRTYYGICLGDAAANDPSGALPITTEESSGAKSGSIIITLVP